MLGDLIDIGRSEFKWLQRNFEALRHLALDVSYYLRLLFIRGGIRKPETTCVFDPIQIRMQLTLKAWLVLEVCVLVVLGPQKS